MRHLYFTINLNKYGELKKKAAQETKTFRYVSISFVLISIIFYIIFLTINSNLQAKLNNRKALLSDIKKEIKSYKVSGEYLSKKDLERLAQLSTERIFWAKKLVALAEKTTDKIAITHFSFKNDVLRLYGITKVDREQKEFDLIDDFIKRLKENKQISVDFPEIQFVKSARDKEKEVDILRFEIDCYARSSSDGGKK